MKSTFSGLQFCRWHWQYGSISIRLAVVAFEMYEIARNSKKIRTCSSSRSSNVIELGVNRKPMYDFLLVICGNFGLSRTVFEILPLKARKNSHPCLTPSLGATPFEFCDEIWRQKTRIVGYQVVKKYNTIVLIQYRRVTDGRTDGQMDGRTRCSRKYPR